MALGNTLDYASLGFASFFLGDVLGKPRVQLSYLWLYFTNSTMRSVAYLGIASKMTADWLFTSQPLTTSKVMTIGLFSYTAYLNLFADTSKKQNTTDPFVGNWRTAASEGSIFGSWWVGGGDGEWFAFLGHNGANELNILPASLLEQMSVSRKDKTKETEEEEGVIVMEEVEEVEEEQVY
ncbi:hypothetical protein BC833DRAFT_616513 [Globomyces pollinis-pini]|nr:hypothetical protein BC833DRAFT_616513 [Globomyces pollinis-pini]